MALIIEFVERASDRSSPHGPVTCGFHSFQFRGQAYLQLDTYGSQDREIPGKVSQTIQLDETAARELVGIIRRAFPGIERSAGES